MPPKLTRVYRLDSMPITKAQYTEEGYLVDKPILTSVGIFEYHNPDGSVRRELRLPEEVFDPESLASYRGAPIVITHDAGLITKDNVGENQIGTVMSEGYKDGDDVRAEIRIFDTNEMKRCGYKELSLGYNLDLDETPGVYKGQKYDAIQRGIRINHLALVENARAGEQARLNIDSRDKKSSKGEKTMAKKKIAHGDGLLTPDELKKAIAEYRKNHPKTDAEEEEKTEKTVVTSEPTEGPAAPAEPVVEKKVEAEKKVEEDEGEEEEEEENIPIEDKAKEIKARHEDDEDVQMLCDIIDTLLAQKDFDAADEPVDEEKKEEEDPFAEDGKDCENCDGDEEEEKEDPFAEDGDPDELEELKGDGDEDDENFLEDCDDPFKEDGEEEEEEEEEENLDCEDSPIPSFANAGKKLNADSIDRIVRERIKIGMIGRKINLDGLENMSAMKAKKAIINKMRPSIRLDGKSSAYINATYDCCVDDINRNTRKGTSAQRKQMFNQDTADMRRVDNNSAEAARNRMIARAGKKSK